MVFNEQGQIPDNDPRLQAILSLNNTRSVSDASYVVATEKYGIPKSTPILLLPPEESFGFAPKPGIKALLLKDQPGLIEFARLLALGDLPWIHPEKGIIEAPEHFLAELVRSELRHLVVAYAA